MKLMRWLEFPIAPPRGPPTRCGTAVGDPRFVSGLRRSREPWPSMIARVSAWPGRAEAS
jgi:hypothetical protein